MEFEAEAELAHEFIGHRAQFAYNPIIAAGANACTLHYNQNDQACRAGDLLLLEEGEPKKFVVVDKAKVGVAWVPAFAAQYADRLSRSTLRPKPSKPKKTPAAKHADRAQIAARLAEFKKEISTYEELSRVGTARWREILDQLKVPNRGALRVGKGTMIAKLAEVLGLEKPGPPNLPVLLTLEM